MVFKYDADDDVHGDDDDEDGDDDVHGDDNDEDGDDDVHGGNEEDSLKKSLRLAVWCWYGCTLGGRPGLWYFPWAGFYCIR